MFLRFLVTAWLVLTRQAITRIPTSIFRGGQVMLILECPRCGSGNGDPTAPSLDGAPCAICLSCKEVSLRADWTAGEKWTGRIVTASFENGTGGLDCGLEDCECPEHETDPPPAGTYVTIRLDGKGHRIGLSDVTVIVDG